jgi:pyruvate/2-oxoglutarate dehydrogenase complex dihydrolipoamide dehydrogenase (E3) component
VTQLGFGLKEYDVIAIGSGSAMNIVDIMIRENPNLRVAVVDKDELGGICLTRGCIPSKRAGRRKFKNARLPTKTLLDHG